jgi:methionyl-tRNA formyltransferase
LEEKKIIPMPQDNSRATLAPILKKEDGQVNFGRTAVEIHNRLRGFQPWPGAYTQLRGKNMKIVAAQPSDISVELPAAEMRVNDSKLLVGCGANTVLEEADLGARFYHGIPAGAGRTARLKPCLFLQHARPHSPF